jgi:hypothetical protein
MQVSPPANLWNSLEVTKLAIGLLTPAAVAGLGFYLQRASERLHNKQIANQKIVEKRLAIYDEIAPMLNDLLCYFTYVGRWREMDPPEVIKLKRELDKKLHLAAPLFPASWAEHARAFTHACFKTFGREWGQNAQLRTQWKNRSGVHTNPWQQEWEVCFCDELASPPEVQQLYQNVVAEFSRSFGELDFVPSNALAQPWDVWKQIGETPPETPPQL